MRVHIQNDPADPMLRIDTARWRAAAEAAGEPPHDLSFGTTPEDFLRKAAEAELLLGPIAALLALRPFLRASGLRLVFTLATGVDALAPFDWLPPGTALLNNRGVHGPKAGAFAAMAVLMLATQMPALIAAQRAQRWEPIATPALAGQRVTIVGTGDLGTAAARALRGFGVHLTGVRTRAVPHPDFDATAATEELDALLPHTACLLLACPLTPATRGLLDRRRIGLLPQGAGVVNIGRGALLDSEALCDALDAGRLGGAVLDVFDHEPLPQGHRAWTTPNLIVTPHVSCDDPMRYVPDSLAVLFNNLRAWRAGEALPNRVDPARGY